MATVTKNSRFDMRMTPVQRKEVERAAALQGKTLTQWALDHLMEAARYDIEQSTTTHLSANDFAAFAAALEAPMPTKAKQLMERKAVWEK